jgi:hypothetical protein
VSADIERAAFEVWWQERNEKSWAASLTPSEQGRPAPENWGAGLKTYALWGWQARAAIHQSTGVAAGVSEQAADSARLDWLEQRGNDGGLLLHAGNQDTGGRSGLGLVNTGRTLRQAVDSARGVKATAKSATATTEKEKS